MSETWSAPTPESLLCVEITLDPADEPFAEAIEGALWELDIAGLERQDDETWSDLVEDPRPRRGGSIRWRVHLDTASDESEAVAAFEAALPQDPRLAVDAWRMTDLSFLTSWKAFFKPTLVSPRILIHPPWEVPSVEPGVVRVQIDPGMAFGTGTHETTRLCLVAIDQLVVPGQSVLDVGTGSGILAIAALLLGASDARGTDNDPIAVRVARENAAINGVAERFLVDVADLDHLTGTWPLVLANILPHILLEMAPQLAARTAVGGHLVLSGILSRERERVRDGFDPLFPEASVLEEEQGDWCSITYCRA